MVDAVTCTERLQVLLAQDATHYRTTDYLSRMQADRDAADQRDQDASLPGSKRRKSTANTNDLPSSSNPDNNGESSSSNGSSCNSSASASSSHINKHWREKICEWAYQGKSENLCLLLSFNFGIIDQSNLVNSTYPTVVDHFDLNREVVGITMNHLDRFLATCDHDVEKNTFQLLAMTSLYLAIKLNEYKHLLIPGSKSSMDTILQLSRGFFTLKQMEKMENDILQRLQWHVHPPTPQLFVKHFLCFLTPEHQEIHDLAQFLVELSVMDYFFVSFKQSEVAVAAILNAIEDIMPHNFSHMDFSYIVHFCPNSHNVLACRERLALIYAQANDHPTTGTYSQTPTKGNSPPTPSHVRTTSPVSVMAPPQPTSRQYYDPYAAAGVVGAPPMTNNHNDAMDTELNDADL